MPVFLRVKEGQKLVDVAVLTSKPLIIGRAPDVDVPFPNDIKMSSRHACLEVKAGVCFVHDLGSTNGTYLNEEQIQECSLSEGEYLRCGSTEFSVEFTDTDREIVAPASPPADVVHSATMSGTATTQKPRSSGSTPTALPPELQQDKGFVNARAIEVYLRFALQKLISVAPDGDESTEKFAVRLLSSGEENDCLYFLAYALPKRMGVWWLTQCIRTADSLKSEADPAMLEAAEAWVKSPSDELRRKAMKLAEDLEMATPASWAGVGAFWSLGSMAPLQAPDVPVPDALAGKAISGGAILATVVKTPEHAAERRIKFVELAIEISSGQRGWKQE